ncbi:still life, sif-like protein [Sarcoptes scabiei]|uniref:Still life, sif-like protein n=1 Tax=Sarcoptes scabiei TaxID=52283 RepID=A0A132A8Z9_SARSC|nr:still life, sif-like protein [Sarcoptes scabiei]
MGNKISCANCNGKPASSATGSAHHHHHHYHQQSTMGGSGGPMNVSIASGSGRSTNYAHHSQVLSGSCGGPMTNILSGRSNHILRLWAEVFHVSASSGAVSGDTWGLNFTSPTDARAFRECLQSGTIQLKTSSGSGSGGHTLPKRAESSYSLRGGEHSERVQQPSKAGSGAHLTTKYYSNRGAMSTPNSPSRRRLQQHYQQQQQQQQQQLLHHQQQQQHHQSHQNMNDQYAQQPQCTCDCLTAEMLHKQRNGRIRYANFTRQDSGGTTQSSRSDGSLVRRQHERQQQYQRSVQQRSIEDQSKKRVSGVAGTTARIIGPGHRRPVASNLQQAQQASRIAQQSAGGDQQSCPPSAQNGSYIQIQHQKAIVHATNSKDISLEKSSASQLEEYERELRRKLLHGDGDSGQNDAMETFETLLKESMDDVANLMREVQHELTLIRAEEKRYQSQSTQSLHRISSNSFGGGTRSPVFDTMSIDGQLPFLPSFATSLAKASSAYQNAYQSWDRLGGYLTSSEVSDDERASLTTAISDDEDHLLNAGTKSSYKSKGSSVSFECLGSVRKSGFLSVKKWLIRKRQSLELARKRGWKGYWNSFGSAGINVNDSEVPISFVINQQQQQDSSLIPTISATTSATMSANNPLGSNPNTIATARIVINLILLTGEHRTIEVPNNCTSEQLLSDIFGPGLEFKEYFLRCSETGTILYRNDLLSNYHNQTLIVVPKQLVTLYLEPLSQNNFLTQADIKVLFGSILKVIDAQNEFRSELTEVGEHILGDCEFLLAKYEQQQQQQDNQDSQDNTEPSVNELGVGYIADCFVKHSKNFRDYSTFCASHARAVKLMAQEKTVVHEWLQKQSNGQISQSLESYLIRPIQRVLKYPLLLSQMKALCRKGTNNYNKLEDAIKDLEKVAEHINEMQRIQEEYGAIFEHLARNHTRLSAGPNYGPNVGQNGVIDLSPPALKHSMCSVSLQRDDQTTKTDADSKID